MGKQNPTNNINLTLKNPQTGTVMSLLSLAYHIYMPEIRYESNGNDSQTQGLFGPSRSILAFIK